MSGDTCELWPRTRQLWAHRWAPAKHWGLGVEARFAARPIPVRTPSVRHDGGVSDRIDSIFASVPVEPLAGLTIPELAGVDVVISDEILDRIDQIVSPAETIGAMDMVYRGPEVGDPTMRRRPTTQRSAA
jgi:hypothetical protein